VPAPTHRFWAALLLLVSPLGFEAREPKPDYSQRYLLIDAFKLATLRKEINEAAGAGYRVVNAVPLRTSGGDVQALLLEKTRDATGLYDYLFITPPAKQALLGRAFAKQKPLAEDLNAGGQEGFRLLPHTVAASRGHETSGASLLLVGHQAVLERSPATSLRYQYVVLEADCKPDTLRKVRETVAQGYEIVGITAAGVVLEKLVEAVAETRQTGEVGSELAARPQYLCLDTVRTSTLKQEMNEAAAAGYRVIAFGFGRVMYLERAAAPPETYEYRLLSYREGLQAAGEAGFRLRPESSRGGNLLMEKPPGTTTSYEYLILAERTIAGTAKALNDASQRGFSVVGITQDTDRGVGICVMEKSFTPPPQ